MNWRNPFLITYLAVTVAGTGILGYLLYSSYSHYTEVSTNYDEGVLKLQKLQNRVPFPSAENNQKYVEYTKQYRTEYDKLLAKVGSMQKSVEEITPQAFQDRLRENVSQVQAAATANGVKLPDSFYLGFGQYQGTLPSDSAAGPLARELAAIRLIVDNLIQVKVKEISEIQRDLLPEESGGGATDEPGPQKTRNVPGQRGNTGVSRVASNSFVITFVGDQNALRSSLDFIVNANQFFLIRYLNVQNSALEGPKRVETATAQATPPPSGGADAALGALLGSSGTDTAAATPQRSIRVLVGTETLTVALRIEMITFNNLPSRK